MRFPKTLYDVLSIVKLRLLAENQWFNETKLSLAWESVRSSVFPLTKTLVSSANNLIEAFGTQFVYRSHTKIARGPEQRDTTY